MEGPLFAPETLTGIGCFLFTVLFGSWLIFTGRLHTDKEFQREHEIGENYRKAYEREIAAKDIRVNSLGHALLEGIQTVGHAIESIQDEARQAQIGGDDVPKP